MEVNAVHLQGFHSPQVIQLCVRRSLTPAPGTEAKSLTLLHFQGMPTIFTAFTGKISAPLC